jgi:hypothetical protein
LEADQEINARFMEERLVARLTSLFGALALLLAALGLYGVTAYTVVRRTSEIGIRMALGAERSRVITMVLRGTMLQALFGLLIGVPVSMICVCYVKSQLYEISTVNFSVILAAIATLAVSAAIAGIIPARPSLHQPCGGAENWMNHINSELREDRFHCLLEGRGEGNIVSPAEHSRPEFDIGLSGAGHESIWRREQRKKIPGSQ